WNRRKNGEVFPEYLSIAAVKDTKGIVTNYVATYTDFTMDKAAGEQIKNLAFYDPLTHLPNRRLFIDRFNAALSASERHRDYGATLLIDLDRFKMLNDMHGHSCGDLLLKEVAVRIKSCVREMDTVARFGGDEFVVLIEALSEDRSEAIHKVAVVAEKIRESLTQPYKLKEREHYSSPSIGISLFHSSDETVDSLIEYADIAMYQAKSSGRNTVRFFDPNMKQLVRK
ncbi:MAG: diguanylate cyclase, partial [Gallionella sp.]